MGKKYKTEQEEFWSGEFGDEYVERNESDTILSSNIALFSKIIDRTRNIGSIIEFGSNIGMNLKAIKRLLPSVRYSAVEINHNAVTLLKKDPDLLNCIDVYEESILDYDPTQKHDMSLIKGVLIHIDPKELETVYRKLYESSSRYVCIVEYYNPKPVSVEYRGFNNKLFKRDFAGEFMDMFDDMYLVDYGFVYHRDNNYSMDDATWFLLEK